MMVLGDHAIKHSGLPLKQSVSTVTGSCTFSSSRNFRCFLRRNQSIYRPLEQRQFDWLVKDLHGPRDIASAYKLWIGSDYDYRHFWVLNFDLLGELQSVWFIPAKTDVAHDGVKRALRQFTQCFG